MELLQKILALFGVREFLLACIVFVPLERLVALRRDQCVFRDQWGSDLLYMFVNGLLIKVGLVVLVLTVGRLMHMLVPGGLQAWVAGQPLWLQTIEAIVVADLGFYAAHRAFHSVPRLWKFHAVHHSIEELDWLAAVRIHPVDQIATKGMSMLPLYALGFTNEALGIFTMAFFWHSLLLHANVRLNFGSLQWLIASPMFHRWHHANEPGCRNVNFAAQLAAIDWLFDTFRMPAARTPERYGIDDDVPDGYAAQLIYPFER